MIIGIGIFIVGIVATAVISLLIMGACEFEPASGLIGMTVPFFWGVYELGKWLSDFWGWI